MLLHRYTVFVILIANGILLYTSGLVFDLIPLSIYALQSYVYLSWTLITICIVIELLFLYNGVFLFLCFSTTLPELFKTHPELQHTKIKPHRYIETAILRLYKL